MKFVKESWLERKLIVSESDFKAEKTPNEMLGVEILGKLKSLGRSEVLFAAKPSAIANEAVSRWFSYPNIFITKRNHAEMLHGVNIIHAIFLQKSIFYACISFNIMQLLPLPRGEIYEKKSLQTPKQAY